MFYLITHGAVTERCGTVKVILIASCISLFVVVGHLMAMSHINGLGQRTSPYTKNNSSADEITNPVEDFGVGGHKT